MRHFNVLDMSRRIDDSLMCVISVSFAEPPSIDVQRSGHWGLSYNRSRSDFPDGSKQNPGVTALASYMLSQISVSQSSSLSEMGRTVGHVLEELLLKNTLHSLIAYSSQRLLLAGYRMLVITVL